MGLKTFFAKGKFKVMLISMVATLLATIIWVNFSMGDKKVEQEIPHLYSVADPQFQRTLGVMLGPAIAQGNRFTALINGDEIFPAMLTAIRGAQTNISFETYIYWDDDIGREFVDALSERARAGVKVQVLLDWVGSNKIDKNYLTTLEQAGAEVKMYRPLRWYNIGRINNRTHRKLLVVDGRIGFTGGVGIAAQWTGNAQGPEHWRDSHFRVEGPVVAQMQATALANWTKTTGKVLHGAEFFPAIKPAGTGSAQMFSSSPTGGSDSMHLMYLLAITAAKESIHISASYFVPDEMMRNALIEAVQRGVRVQIILPGEHIDAEIVRRSSRGAWGDLLQAGVEIHEYQPTMFHCKVMIVDRLLVSVGSTNFDDRSFRLNDEANLNIYDREFARQQVAVFEQDLKKSRRITFAQWQDRPLQEKILEGLASLLGPVL